ncbi:MAG: hypothetical protein ABWZ42_01045, partial [Ilumatobacteraceae bacterium]
MSSQRITLLWQAMQGSAALGCGKDHTSRVQQSFRSADEVTIDQAFSHPLASRARALVVLAGA